MRTERRKPASSARQPITTWRQIAFKIVTEDDEQKVRELVKLLAATLPLDFYMGGSETIH